MLILLRGVRATITEGSPGIDRNTYEVTYSDGEEINRVLLSTERVREPEERVVGVGPADSTGTATMAMATTDDGASFYYKNSLQWRLPPIPGRAILQLLVLGLRLVLLLLIRM